MRVEIQGLWLLFASILDGCQVLQDEIAEKKALVKSLQNSVRFFFGQLFGRTCLSHFISVL